MLTIDLLKKAISQYFCLQDHSVLLDCLTEDVSIFGLTYDAVVLGKKNFEKLVHKICSFNMNLYEFKFVKEYSITDENAAVEVNIKSGDMTSSILVSATSRIEDGVLKLSLIHCSTILRKKNEQLVNSMVEKKILEKKIELVASSMPGGIISAYLDKNFPISYVNKGMLKLLKYNSKSQFLKDCENSVSNIIHPEDIKMVHSVMVNAISKPGNYWVDCRLKAADGTYVWTHNVGSKIEIENGEFILLAVSYDVNTEISYKHKLEESLNAYNLITKFMNIWTWTIDLDNDTVRLDDKFVKDFGFSNVDSIPLNDFIATDFLRDENVDLFMSNYKKAKNGDKKIVFESKILVKDGSTHWVRISFFELDEKVNGHRSLLCSAVLIDAEKSNYAIIEQEKFKIVNHDKSIMGYNIINISKDYVVEHTCLDGDVKFVSKPFNTIDELVNLVDTTIVEEEHKVLYNKYHNTEFLNNAFFNGQLL